MSPQQIRALELLAYSRANDHAPHGVGSTECSALLDGQAWIHWQTAEALERDGYVRIRRIEAAGERSWEVWLYPGKWQCPVCGLSDVSPWTCPGADPSFGLHPPRRAQFAEARPAPAETPPTDPARRAPDQQSSAAVPEGGAR